MFVKPQTLHRIRLEFLILSLSINKKPLSHDLKSNIFWWPDFCAEETKATSRHIRFLIKIIMIYSVSCWCSISYFYESQLPHSVFPPMQRHQLASTWSRSEKRTSNKPAHHNPFLANYCFFWELFCPPLLHSSI